MIGQGTVAGGGESAMSTRGTDDPESDLSYELSGINDSDAFFEATAAMLSAVFHCEGVAWNHLDLERQTAWLRGTPAELEDEPMASLLAHHAADHPVIQSYLATSTSTPRRMSDVSSRSDLLRSGSYVEVLRPLGIHYQLSVMTTRSGKMAGGGWALSRGLHDFTEDDVKIATRVQAMLSQLTYRKTRPRASSMDECGGQSDLTERELEVLRLVAEGHTAQAAGRLLRISPATIRKHLERVYVKLDVHDKMNAVRRAQERGILPQTQSEPRPVRGIRTGWIGS